MKQKAIMTLLALMIVSLTLGVALAQPTVEVSPKVAKPGESVIITGAGVASSSIIIEVSNTRATLESFNITTDSAGEYEVKYQLPDDAPIDIYTVRISTEDESAETTFMVSHMTQQQVANNIKTMVMEAKKRAETALIEARKEGHVVPLEIRVKYSQGLAELDNAANAIQIQNYVSAQGTLQNAMNLFREVVEYTFGDDVVQPINAEQLKRRLQEKIDQLKRQYHEINAAVEKLNQNGLNVETLQRELETLRVRIGEAQSLLDEGNITEAAQRIEQTQQVVTQRLASLRQRQAEITKRLAERYKTALETRVQAYINTFQLLQAVRPVQSALALQELATLRQRLTVSGTAIENGNLVTALQEMKSTEYRLKRLSDTVNGPYTSRLLSRIDELTASLDKSTGIDIVKIETEIENTQDELNDYLRRSPPQGNTDGSTTQKPRG
ncbi:hypothetical protein E2P71_07390 [Candidatus Bathyarchaeota archaeon]|nr:hypothetical protein E2P71_07390 [Candidatus Bathyarchaeota archaeon]